MKRTEKKPLILLLSIPLAALVIFASLTGISTPALYAAETPNWQSQTIGQDWVDLILVVPSLLISSILAFLNKKGAIYVWAGVMTYLLYTFLIYCVAVHFNRLFIVYCFAMGLSFYGILWFLYTQLFWQGTTEDFSRVPARLAGICFILLSLVFYMLWLAEIIPAIRRGEAPKSVKDTGLVTNIVHVLDLAVFLPGIFITGLLLVKRKKPGFIMAPVLLSFFVLMDITIGALVVFMKQRGLEGSYILTVLMGIMSGLSLMLLVYWLRQMNISKNG